MTGLVVFDCDGVLVDSEPLVARVESELLAEWSVELSAAEILERFVGRSERDVLAEIEHSTGVTLGEAFARAKAEALDAAFDRDLRPVPGIPELLGALDRPRCVASSSHLRRIGRSLAVTGLDRHFGDHLYSATMVRHGKPAPDLFLHAAASMGADPGSCVVVEDSVAGVRAGVAAGMDVVGFTAGSHCPADAAERLAAAGARRVAASSDELGGLLG